MDSTTQSSYDDILYNSWPFSQSHPDRLATVATMFGMDPPPVRGEEFRMLELGSACGDNLIPLAMQHPRAEFVGIDSSQRQVEIAINAASRLGVGNVRFQKMDMLNYPDSSEPFDYISAHGIYSWVPVAVRDKLLAICHQHLQPNGVAYVSYNVFPGCQMKKIVRDALIYHVRHLTDPQERIQQAIAFLRFMAESVPHPNPAYAALYKGTLESLGHDGAANSRLYHDLMEPTNDPVYFHEFIDHAAKHNLQFLGEANVHEMQSMRFPAEVSSVLDKLGDDCIQREQYLDFFKHQPFRQTLLCHRDVSLDRKLLPDRIEGLLLATEIHCDTPDGNLQSTELFRFRDEQGVEASIDHPLTKAALLELRASWPHAVPFAELEVAARRRLRPVASLVQRSAEFARERQELSEHLLQLYAAGLVEAHIHQPQFTTQVSVQPVASSWARLQAERGRKVTNRWHTGVSLSEINREMLLLLDGTRDRNQLVEDLAQRMATLGLIVVHEGKAVQGSDHVRGALNEMLDEALQTAASLALLVA